MFLIANTLIIFSFALVVLNAVIHLIKPNPKRTHKFTQGMAILLIAFSILLFILGVGSNVLMNFLPVVLITATMYIYLSEIYYRFTKTSDNLWFRFLLLVGLGTTSLMGSFPLAFLYENYYFIDYIFPLIALNAIGAIGYIILFKLTEIVNKRTKVPTSFRYHSDKLQHYKEEGLSDDEIAYLREQLAQLREHVISIEEQMNQTAKLRAIDVRHNTVKMSQQLFRDIVREPKRFSQLGNVVYRIIPSLDDLTQKYNEINSHLAKSKQTYLILEKSAKTIDDLSSRLTEEYLAFHEDTFQELDDEIKLANRSLHKSSDINDTDSVDDILDDWEQADQDLDDF